MCYNKSCNQEEHIIKYKEGMKQFLIIYKGNKNND